MYCLSSTLRASVIVAVCAGPMVSAARADMAGAVPTTPSSSIAASATPANLYGPLFEAVQTADVFPDSKTFVDLVPKEVPERIMRAYAAEHPSGRAALAAFVARHFATPDEAKADARGLRGRIRDLWPILARPPLAPAPGGTGLSLPEAYVVPGGRYQEFYYWDSYFTMLGLWSDKQTAMIEAMLGNFVSLVERYGHVPNGTRSYYLSRSQPPFLALMMDLSQDGDPVLARRRLAALRREYDYWMDGTACLGAAGACRHVVRMPDGSLLNRYWDARDTPREESYAEDRKTAAQAVQRPPAEVYRDLRAAAESGWDFSSRWLGDGRTLATIRTTSVVPVDLNSLLWTLETSIARRCGKAGDTGCSHDFDVRAASRAAAMNRYLWDDDEHRFADWDRQAGASTPTVSAALLVPLFAGWASPLQGEAMARLTEQKLVAPGGVRTTLAVTGQQWDAPNGWAPLQWMAVDGLGRYGESALARRIAERWLANVGDFYRATGRLVEKYDVEERRAGGGGEYAVQDGFGWTNGVTSGLLDRFPSFPVDGGTALTPPPVRN